MFQSVKVSGKQYLFRVGVEDFARRWWQSLEGVQTASTSGLKGAPHSHGGSRFLARCLKLLEGLFKPGQDLSHGRFFDTPDGIPAPIMDGFPDRGQLGWR